MNCGPQCLRVYLSKRSIKKNTKNKRDKTSNLWSPCFSSRSWFSTSPAKCGFNPFPQHPVFSESLFNRCKKNAIGLVRENARVFTRVPTRLSKCNGTLKTLSCVCVRVCCRSVLSRLCGELFMNSLFSPRIFFSLLHCCHLPAEKGSRRNALANGKPAKNF